MKPEEQIDRVVIIVILIGVVAALISLLISVQPAHAQDIKRMVTQSGDTVTLTDEPCDAKLDSPTLSKRVHAMEGTTPHEGCYAEVTLLYGYEIEFVDYPHEFYNLDARHFAPIDKGEK